MHPRSLILALVFLVPVLILLIALITSLSGAGTPQAVDPSIVPDPIPTVIPRPFCGSCV
jgi:hypothetical protein